MAHFLSPPTRHSSNQSQATPPPGQGDAKTKTRDPQELPARAKKKSKKVQKQERKRERRRAKLHRACKDDKVAEPQTPQSSTPTPMPSPADLSLDGAAQDEILITDQSLSELLASTNHTGDILNHNDKDLDTDSSLQSNDCSDRIVRLEANLVAVNLDLQCKHDECVALQNQIDLLNEEMDCYKKTDKNQKNEIKRLTNENDRLIKELSKHSGVRRYFDKSPSEPSKSQGHDLSVKYDKLRSKLTEITDSLVTALEDGFYLCPKRKPQPCSLVIQWINPTAVSYEINAIRIIQVMQVSHHQRERMVLVTCVPFLLSRSGLRHVMLHAGATLSHHRLRDPIAGPAKRNHAVVPPVSIITVGRHL